LSAVSTRPNLSAAAEHDELRRTVRQFLADMPTVRSVMATTEGFDRATWRGMAEQVGLQALLVPERYEGLGQGAVEANVVFEEMGRALYSGPYFASAALAVYVLLCSGDEAACRDLLPGIAAGTTIATAALDGSNAPVLHGHVADLVLVTDGSSLFAVDSGIQAQPIDSLDLTRKLATVKFERGSARPVGKEGGAPKTIAAATDRALVCLAAEEAGGAARCLEMSVAYAKQREQFGRPIGSFQAIAHRCVEMLQRVEFARAAVRYAASCLDEKTSEFPIAARAAAAYCGQAYRWVAGESIQVHGGIGFTWEHDAHLHYRRAWADEALLGTTDQHYLAIADRLGL
jgi:alkylation response protein AidB-like acyl-CoA dehydrogenase